MLTQIWINDLQLADGVMALAAPVHMPGTNAVQKAIPLRAPGVVNFNRITKSYTVELAIVRLHACAMDAVQFRASHNANDIPNVADLTMEWTDGTVTVTAVIAGAAWDEVDPQLIGEISTRTTYRISGGPMVVERADSAAPQNLETESGVPIETESGTNIIP